MEERGRGGGGGGGRLVGLVVKTSAWRVAGLVLFPLCRRGSFSRSGQTTHLKHGAVDVGLFLGQVKPLT